MGVSKLDFDAAWSLIDVAERVERTLPKGLNRLDQELREGAQADYYLVHCYPGQDAKALRWLARRRFAAFQPMQQRRDRNNPDKKYAGYEPAFPGWLFVFCWDIKEMQHRILAAPGVMDILRDPVTEQPLPVDQPLMTEDQTGCVWPRIGFIDRLLSLAWVYDANAPVRSHAAVTGQRHVKRSKARFTKQQRRTLDHLKQEMLDLNLWDSTDWTEANKLEPGERIRLLMATLDKHRQCSVALVA